MKKIILNNIWLIGLIVGLFATSLSITSCKSDDDSNSPISVSNVYQESSTASVTDRLVTFARLGQTLRIEGSGFSGLKKIYVNGYETYFNPAFVTDNNIIFSVSSSTPTIDAATGVRNTIRLVKDGAELTYTFEIRSAAPAITGISHTLPAAGDVITIYGSGLTEISKVTFPGDVSVTTGIVSDKAGTYCQVTVPSGLTESGSILVIGSNGGAYSPAYFNCKKNVILDFDGTGSQGYWSWSATGSMLNNTDLQSAKIGSPVASQGNYCAHRPSRITSFAAAKNRLTEVWTAGTGSTDDWRTYLSGLIPTTTKVSDFAFQFDIYVPNTWNNTGYLQIVLYNNFNGGEWTGKCYNYVPWIVNGVATPFKTDGWVTVTIPFSSFYAYSSSASTTTTYYFEDVIAAREAATYKNFGIYFNNSDIKLSNITGKSTDATVFSSSATAIDVYTDNWRIVPLTQPTYSDFTN